MPVRADLAVAAKEEAVKEEAASVAAVAIKGAAVIAAVAVVPPLRLPRATVAVAS